MRAHWSLIVADPNKADVEEFLNGEAQTVGMKQAVQRLKKVAKITVPANAVNSFDELRKHRNQMVHFYYQIDVNDPNRKKQREAVIIEQCRGWFYLRRLLADDWAKDFATFQTEIFCINTSMKQHREYLRTIYEQIRPELEIEERQGAFLATCSACGFDAQVLNEPGPQEHKCRVCLAKESFLLHKCKNKNCSKNTLLPIDMSLSWECEYCGDAIDLGSVLFEYTIEGKADHDEPNQPALCTECVSIPETAGTLDDGETVFCFNCFNWPEKIDYCQWCNDPFTGDASDTYWSGCERCEGKAGWTRDE